MEPLNPPPTSSRQEPYPSPHRTAQLLDRYLLKYTTSLNDTCTICQQQYGTGDEPEMPTILPRCTHIYGARCIAAWINGGSNSCPLCREIVFENMPAIRPNPQDADGLANAAIGLAAIIRPRQRRNALVYPIPFAGLPGPLPATPPRQASSDEGAPSPEAASNAVADFPELAPDELPPSREAASEVVSPSESSSILSTLSAVFPSSSEEGDSPETVVEQPTKDEADNEDAGSEEGHGGEQNSDSNDEDDEDNQVEEDGDAMDETDDSSPESVVEQPTEDEVDSADAGSEEGYGGEQNHNSDDEDQDDNQVEEYGDAMDETDDDQTVSEGSVMHELNSPPPPPPGPNTAEDDRVYAELESWRPDWSFNTDIPDHVPTHWARHAEALYSDLCEGIVCFIEDRTTPEDWIDNRYPLAKILMCLTFEQFVGEMSDAEGPLADEIQHLRATRRTSRNMELIDQHLVRAIGGDPHFMYATVETHYRFAAWHRRIQRAHNRHMNTLIHQRDVRRRTQTSAGRNLWSTRGREEDRAARRSVHLQTLEDADALDPR